MNKLLISDLSGWVMFCATGIASDFDMLNIFLYNKYAKASDDRS